MLKIFKDKSFENDKQLFKLKNERRKENSPYFRCYNTTVE